MNKAWIAVGAVAVVMLVVVVVFMGNGTGTVNGGSDVEVEFEEVVVRDLEAITTLDGTLGFPEGDSVTSRLAGTITDVAPVGKVIEEGDVLFTIDGEPIVFLQGALPAFRGIGSEPTLLTVTAQLAGTITSTPDVDDVLAFNAATYHLDDIPVMVLPGDVPAWRDLDEGDEGIDVEQLEAALVALGYDPGGLEVDGVFTSYTDLMIDAWQEEVGLAIDGRFNLADAFFVPTEPAVVDVLVSVGDRVNVGSPVMVVATGAAASRRTLREGDRGLAVRDLQELLAAAGFDPGEADGTFGDDTEVAVETLQSSRNLEVTGVVDQATWDALDVVAEEPTPDVDVVQLQKALQRLGYSVPATGVADAATTAAIEAWQADIGAEVDGIVDLGEVVFLPTPVRITEALLTVGSPVGDGSAVLATSSSASVVLVDLPADDQDLLEVGLQLTVVMPDGSEVAATVTEISGIAVLNAAGDVVFETTIELVDTTVGADLDQAPVDVLVVTDSRSQVITVPVTALLALVEGGYAVEVEQADGSVRLVGVEPGLFADGWVEVVSDALAAGDRVVVP